MTKDEIMAMHPGRELDALVAEKVMGWHTVELTPVNNGWFWSDGNKHIAWDSFSPSTDISAAWEVVEKMRTEHKQYITIIDNPHLNYDVRFSGSKSKEYHRLSNLPYAICRAALLAVME